MRVSHSLMVVFALTFYSCSNASPTTKTTTDTNEAITSSTPLESLRSLRGIQTDDDENLRTHKAVGTDNNDGEEERGGGNWFNKFRYQSEGAHGAEDLNQVTMADNFLKNNQQLFNAIRSDQAKRFETYAIWRGMKYPSADIKTAMIDHGFSKGEYEAFVKEYKKFKPHDLRFK